MPHAMLDLRALDIGSLGRALHQSGRRRRAGAGDTRPGSPSRCPRSDRHGRARRPGRQVAACRFSSRPVAGIAARGFSRRRLCPGCVGSPNRSTDMLDGMSDYLTPLTASHWRGMAAGFACEGHVRLIRPAAWSASASRRDICREAPRRNNPAEEAGSGQGPEGTEERASRRPGEPSENGTTVTSMQETRHPRRKGCGRRSGQAVRSARLSDQPTFPSFTFHVSPRGNSIGDSIGQATTRTVPLRRGVSSAA